jgi:hypothetical protein
MVPSRTGPGSKKSIEGQRGTAHAELGEKVKPTGLEVQK